MWKNYIVIALRELRGHAAQTTISVAGLAIGLAACLLILAHIRFETGYDHWVPDVERIYSFSARAEIQRSSDHVIIYGSAPYAAVLVFPEQVPGVEAGAVMAREEALFLKEGTAQDFEVISATPSFLDFFPLATIAGDPKRALADPGSAVLTSGAAERLFGRVDVLGRALETAGGERYKVAAVVRDLPQQTHFEADILLPFRPDPDAPLWEQSGLQQVYLTLAPGADAERVRRDLEAIIRENMAAPDFMGETVETDYTALLCPLAELHTTRGLCNMLGKPAADPDQLSAFGAIGAVILLLAIVNFANISASRSSGRRREVAMRKALGATRVQIAGQFVSESVLIAMMALTLGIGLAELANPAYSTLIGRNEPLALFAESGALIGIVLLALLAGISGGLYPAALSLRMRPASIFAGIGPPKARPWLSNALIGIQFVAGVALGVATLISHQQFRYLQSADLGFDPRDVVIVNGDHDDGEAVRALFSALQQETSFSTVALASSGPAMQGMLFAPVAATAEAAAETMEILYVTEGYFDVFGIDVRLAPGVDGLEQRWREGAVIVNEKAAARLGFARPQDALGEFVYRETDGESEPLEIIGMTRDLYLRSIQSSPQPAVFHPAKSDAPTNYLVGRIAADRSDDALTAIDRLWREVEAVVPVTSYFASDRLATTYFETLRRNRLAFAFATGIAITIAVLGLFGMAAHVVERRTHEVAIRKVLGARTLTILNLLLWQFARPVLAATVLGWAAAFYFMNSWLEEFSTRIDLGFWPFLLAGASALVIALFTVSGHAVRVARTHPALALREE